MKKTIGIYKIFFILSVFIFHFPLLFAQINADHIAPLQVNPVLVKYTKQAIKNHKATWWLISDSIVLNLPFLDDFSHGGPYPDTALWVDNAAFINNTYPLNPPTIGVATLDGVNGQGQPYNPNCPVGASYPADSLTSRFINLAQYNPLTASIYFSFYWQAGGRSPNPPMPNDTLLLQFRTSTTPWTTIWYHLGYYPGPDDTNFHLVMIPMLNTTQTAFGGKFNVFNSNFQFRFKNYACTSGNADQWNIDEVFIDQNRSVDDTARNDVAFVYPAPSLLANYQYMPWEQFTQNDLIDTVFMKIRNNGNGPDAMNYRDTILPVGAAYPIGTGYDGEVANIAPYYNSGYLSGEPQLTNIPIKGHYNYTALTGPANITMTHIITTTNDFILWNDTMRYDQIFSNYYAYDDGTAEATYIINGNTPLELAYKITLNKTDTLRGILMAFNYMFDDPANEAFRLALWDNQGPGGSPGNLRFESDSLYTPSFTGGDTAADSLNGFVYYPFYFDKDSTLAAGSTFYVGLIQTEGDSINIGFDLNTNHMNKIYYNANVYPADWPTGWDSGNYAGSMMMRPVFGSPYKPSAILSTSNIKATSQSIGIYPNPANDVVNFNTSLPANTILKIYTADGREYMDNINFYGSSINTSSLPSGFYIVEVTTGGQTFYQKLLIQR